MYINYLSFEAFKMFFSGGGKAVRSEFILGDSKGREVGKWRYTEWTTGKLLH